MSDSYKLKSILKMADPRSNSSYHERKVALDKAHKIMDDTGMSYASVGMSQADAERIETQFSVATPSKPKTKQNETRVSIFSRVRDLAVSDRPSHTPQPQRKKQDVQVPDWEAENERKQREDWDRKYTEWKKWRHTQDIEEAKAEESARKFLRNAAIAFVFVVIFIALVIFSQNAFIINAVVLVAKIFGAIFVVLMAFFTLFVLR